MLEASLPGQARANYGFALVEHRELFEEEHGFRVPTATMSRTFDRLKLLLKEVLFAAGRHEQERRRWAIF